MPQLRLNTIFQAIIISKITYAILALRGFLTGEQVGQINAFLKRCYKYGFCIKLYTIDELADDADYTLLRCKRHSSVYMKSFLRLKPVPFTYVTKATSACELPRCCPSSHAIFLCSFRFLFFSVCFTLF